MRRPRKSILSRPTFSRSPMTHCVVMASPLLAASSSLRLTTLHRDIIGDRPVGDDDAGGMSAGVAIGPFQLAGRCRSNSRVAGSASYSLRKSGHCLQRRRRWW